MSDWICLDLSEYAATCVNMPKSAWMAFVLHFPIVISFLLERVVTFFNVYTKLEVLVWRKMRLFFWRHTIWFNSCMYFIGFCFRLNISTSKISNFCYLWGSRGVGSVNLDIPYFGLLYLVTFVLKHNVDEKNMRNIDVRIHVKLELQELGCSFNISAMRI